MTELENDIGTAMMRLRQVFAKHRIPCPDVLSYDDSKKAYEAVRALRHEIGPTSWAINKNADPFGEVCLAGFTLRFAAEYIDRPGSGLELDDGIYGRVFFDDLGLNRGK